MMGSSGGLCRPMDAAAQIPRITISATGSETVPISPLVSAPALAATARRGRRGDDGRVVLPGQGGGSPAWENVGKFWDYAMRAGDFGAMIVPTAAFCVSAIWCRCGPAAAASITICLWLIHARCALHKFARLPCVLR